MKNWEFTKTTCWFTKRFDQNEMILILLRRIQTGAPSWNTGVLYTDNTAHTQHITSKREYSKGRCQFFFCCHLIWVLPTSPPQLIQPQWPPFPSLLLIEQVWVCLYLLARGVGVDPNQTSAKKRRFLPLYCSLHYMQPHSFSISDLELAIPSTDILRWITDFHTSKQII